MASSKDYLTFVLEQLSGLEGITYRAMMGEYILYFRDKIVGGIYDDRLLVKPVSSAISLIPTVTYELHYEGKRQISPRLASPLHMCHNSLVWYPYSARESQALAGTGG